ncbi:MAG TPA: hypothetical protein VNA04_14645 [Thermoanaerobaculia bacterium]|nr:hypothetical protein [Thermoanaerobaculia bacterium]
MLLVLTAATFLFLGRELSFRLWRRATEPLGFAEQAVSAASIAFGLWLASVWFLALTGSLTATALAFRNIAFAFAAALLWFQRWRRSDLGPPSSPVRAPRLVLVALVPLALWCALMLWRGWVVPPLSHDVLAYHLPKAAFYTRAAAYDPLPAMPARARNIPVNYEMLLADVLLIEGDDAITEWPSVLHYLFFIAAAVALARRWWDDRDPLTQAVIALLAAAVPVALLHSGAHKNDLMTMAFTTAALVWLGRFTTHGELRALLLAAATLMMAVGTKPQAAILAVAAIPFALRRLWMGGRFWSRLSKVVAASVLFIVLLGGAFWPLDRAATMAPAPGSAPQSSSPIRFGDWENLWQVPYVLVAAPFSRSATALAVPWSERPWFWRRFEIYFSELGLPFALCALLLPIGIWRYRRRVPERHTERVVVSILVMVTFVAILPVVFRPLGLYAISAPRYVLFIVPVVFAWTVVPLLRFDLAAGGRVASLALAAVIFVAYAVSAARHDSFVPPRYVAWALRNPGTRVIPFDPNRAASVLDRMAAPDAAVAIEAADGAWLYPAFGAELTRRIELIPDRTAPAGPPDADWVAIDRKFEAVWRHPQFRELGQTGRFISRGATPLEADPLFALLVSHPRWRLVHVEAPAGQAIFQRQPGSSAQP